MYERIIGIDPGYDRIGIAVIEKDCKSKKDAVLYSDCFQTSSDDEIYIRFKEIGEKVAEVIQRFKINVLSIENLFISKNQKTAMRVSEARGIIIYEAIKHGLKVAEYTPMQIKLAVTGDGTSDKSRIIKMVHLLVKLDDKKRVDDEYDAIAVALTHSAISK